MIESVGQIRRAEDGAFLKMWRTLVDPATRMLQDHRHGNFEIATVVSGKGTYSTAAGVLPICAGDVFVFCSNEPHWILQIEGEGLEILNLHFDHACFKAACPIGRQYPNLFYSHSESFGCRIPAAESAPIRRLTAAIRQELEVQEPEHESFVFGHLQLLFSLLVRSYGYYCPGEGVHDAVERIQNSLRFIDEHFAEDITLEQIAAQSNLSPHYFTRLFGESFRMKLWDHVLIKRIDMAKRLLTSQSDITVLEIALQCGFHNTANFNRAFLRFTGMTPSEYRKGVPLH